MKTLFVQNPRDILPNHSILRQKKKSLLIRLSINIIYGLFAPWVFNGEAKTTYALIRTILVHAGFNAFPNQLLVVPS